MVDSAVFQRAVDYPDEYAAGYHVVLDIGGIPLTSALFCKNMHTSP